MTLDDLPGRIGQPLGTSDWIVIDAARIQGFADATLDHQWIHLDATRAAAGPYGGPIAHGFLTLSLLSAMATTAFSVAGARMGVNYGLNRVRFPAAVPAGGRVRGHFVLQSLEPIDGGVQLVLAVTVDCEGVGKPVCVAEWVLRYLR